MLQNGKESRKGKRSQEKIGTQDKTGVKKEIRFDSLIIYG
jgi:hypothetical protein